jgi:hypothetical protein
MLLRQSTPLRRQVGWGWALKNRALFGPCEMASSHQANAIWGCILYSVFLILYPVFRILCVVSFYVQMSFAPAVYWRR